jgi:hypothetical protein
MVPTERYFAPNFSHVLVVAGNKLACKPILLAQAIAYLVL